MAYLRPVFPTAVSFRPSVDRVRGGAVWAGGAVGGRTHDGELRKQVRSSSGGFAQVKDINVLMMYSGKAVILANGGKGG